MEKKKPTFNVSGPSKKRVKERWRRPRGVDNKKRIKRKDRGALPKVGYKKKIRGLHPSGKPELLVKNLKDLEGAKDVVVRISGSVGKKLRKEIVKKAESLGLKILNRGVI